jgi:hypothetical protein
MHLKYSGWPVSAANTTRHQIVQLILLIGNLYTRLVVEGGYLTQQGDSYHLRKEF